MRMTPAVWAATFVLVSSPEARAADACAPARALIVLDRSSSMVTGQIGGTPKWEIAVDALDEVVSAYEDRLELGLMRFPNPNECSPGQVDVPPSLGMRDEIMSALAQPPPDAGNYTPMAQTLDVAAGHASLSDPAKSRYLILVSDGWQWCDPYDPATRFTPVDSVRRLTAKGIITYVVGFGDSVDPVALNQMAVEGGTSLAGCDPDGDIPTAANPCYYRADDANQLVMALSSIAGQVSAEVCDGLDNDCDGTVDSGCDCDPGETRACGTDEGICRAGTQTCTASGTWGMCSGAIGPQSEACNGEDDDCDGEVDDDDSCEMGVPAEGNVSDGCICDASRRGGPGRLPALVGGLFGACLLLSLRRRR
jgi:hypothetical protein